MASVVQICNMALSHLGDTGIISSIDPPDGSIQAGRCSVFYPIARKVILEARDWGFATRRATLALLTDPPSGWLYRYALPSGQLRVVKVLPPSVDTGEHSEPFTLEALADGTVTLLTDTEQATCLFIQEVNNSAVFPPTFTSALAWLLASYLAGPVIKGKEGASFGEYCYNRYATELAVAAMADASQHRQKDGYVPSGIAAR